MPTNKDWKFLSLDQQGAVLTVAFDTKGRINGFTFELMEELIELAFLLESDTDIAAIIIRGRDDIFSGGMDLASVSAQDIDAMGMGKWRQKNQLGPRMCAAWEKLEAVTIAAIEGWCTGAGVALALACDFRVIADDAIFYVPEIERGMTMSWGSVPRMVSLLGPAKTKRLFLLAEKCPATRAVDWGLADVVAAAGSSLQAAEQMATKAAGMPPIALRMCKQSINAAAQANSYSVSYTDTDQLLLTQSSDDFVEGVASFLEKRDPDFKGR